MNKYGNRKTEVDGILFDSKAEARRYGELRLMEAAGEIERPILQPRFTITVNGVKVCTYVADFCYVDLRTGRTIVEDVKGARTAVYRLKKRLMLACHGIDVQEVEV